MIPQHIPLGSIPTFVFPCDPKLTRVQDGTCGFIYILQEGEMGASELSLFKYKTKMTI